MCNILEEYSMEIQDEITKEAQRIALEAKKKLKSSSPKRTGKYSKGWSVKTTKGFGFVQCIVHNSTNYQLTHLLEKPHATRNGGITTPKVHIKPVEESSIKEYGNNANKIIENGGNI